jgi:hypothetical protein
MDGKEKYKINKQKTASGFIKGIRIYTPIVVIKNKLEILSLFRHLCQPADILSNGKLCK